MQAEAGTPLTAPTAAAARRASPRVWLLVVLAVVAVLAYAGDQLSKAWVVANLAEGEQRELAGPVLRLLRTSNSGAAFSLGEGSTWVFTIIATVVAATIVVSARRLGSRGWAVALGLLLGGCLGNLTDRLTRPPGFARGEVVDFLQFPFYPTFPIFNVADSCVVSAAILIGLLAVLGVGMDGRRGSARDD